jgi:O-antigen/teichoic acid export membrane protein
MREVVRKSAAAYLIKIASAALSFAFNVVIARLLGAQGMGVYVLALTIATILSVMTRVGLDNTVLRLTASNLVGNNWARVKGVYEQSRWIVIGVSLAVSLVIVLASSWIAQSVFKEPQLALTLRWMSLAILPMALYVLYAQLLKGLKRTGEAVIIQSLVVQVLALPLLYLLIPRWKEVGAAVAYVIAAYLTWLVAWWLWRRATPLLRTVNTQKDTKELLESSIPLFWSTTFQQVTLWSSTLMLGAFVASDQVGIFGAANRTTLLVSLVLIAVNSISAPKFAALYKEGKLPQLERMTKNSAKLMTLMTLPFAVIFVLFSSNIMKLFGEQFISGAPLLIILTIGQYINVASGSVGFVLMMTGHERLMRNNMAFCACLNIVLNLILIPLYGTLGAAITSAIVLISQNVIAAVMIRRVLGIWTIPFLKSPRRMQ